MTLFFIRHGETAFNDEGRVTGQRDIPLAPRGRDQAAAVGRTLLAIFAERGLDKAAVPFHVSTLERARVTAEIARAVMGLDPADYTTDARLQELSLGNWEGLTMTDVGQRFPANLKARGADPWSVAPTGGETYRQLADRVGAALAGFSRPCIVVAHAGTGRAVLTLDGGVEPHEATRIPIQQGRVLIVENRGFSWR